MLLNELIEQLVLETILEIRTGFKWNEFKELDNQFRRSNYASQHLKQLGSGSSREVYLLSNRHVLKLARPDAKERGIAQNEAEVDIYTDPRTRPIVAKIHASADDYSWLVSELTRPLKSDEEFEDLTGIDMSEFVKLMNSIEVNGSIEKTIDEYEEALEEASWPGEADRIKDRLEMLKNNETLRATGALISNVFLLPADLSWPGHWGKTPDGRAVMLDYGYTEKVFQDYY